MLRGRWRLVLLSGFRGGCRWAHPRIRELLAQVFGSSRASEDDSSRWASAWASRVRALPSKVATAPAPLPLSAQRVQRRVDPEAMHEDRASGKKDDRPHLAACLKALRSGDPLVVWKLDRLGRDLRHLVNIVQDLTQRGIGLKVLTGQGAAADTTTASGKLVFGIFAALAEFERELISERTIAGQAAARARGHQGGRPYKMTPAKVRLARALMGQPGTSGTELCKELGITRQTLYRHVSPIGEVRPDGQKVLTGRWTGRPSGWEVSTEHSKFHSWRTVPAPSRIRGSRSMNTWPMSLGVSGSRRRGSGSLTRSQIRVTSPRSTRP